ncbi:MAG: histidine kinase [Bacteroidetes bacterium]|nr:histidine kinase [Bacteroidota bacterium]
MRLEALRSQMNPHFIFNALNSINRYIIRNSKETASEYLIKFSKLMRMILENSKSTSVTLEK